MYWLKWLKFTCFILAMASVMRFCLASRILTSCSSWKLSSVTCISKYDDEVNQKHRKMLSQFFLCNLETRTCSRRSSVAIVLASISFVVSLKQAFSSTKLLCKGTQFELIIHFELNTPGWYRSLQYTNYKRARTFISFEVRYLTTIHHPYHIWSEIIHISFFFPMGR